MFLHIGADTEVMINDLIAIFDIKSIKDSKITKDFLNISQEEGFITFISEEDAKSVVITEEKGKSVVYVSPISSNTLLKRIKL